MPHMAPHPTCYTQEHGPQQWVALQAAVLLEPWAVTPRNMRDVSVPWPLLLVRVVGHGLYGLAVCALGM